MSYTKTNWHDGDTITAVKMNKIENGIESSLSDALVTLGKALCGDSFEVESGSTDAETILEIAKNYTGGSGGTGTGLPEIVFQMDFTNVRSVVDRDNIGFAILTSKEEAIALGNCVVCLDIINPNDIFLPATMSEGRHYGCICKLFYRAEPSKITGQPDEEFLALNPYSISQGDQALNFPVVPLLDYDTTQHDAWANRDDMASAFDKLLAQFTD